MEVIKGIWNKIKDNVEEVVSSQNGKGQGERGKLI